MGLRPTISVCYNGYVVESWMYNFWRPLSVVIEALYGYEKYKSCKSAHEYLEKRLSELDEKENEWRIRDLMRRITSHFGSDSAVKYNIYSFPPIEDIIEMIECSSEFCMMIDMTEHCIYYSKDKKPKSKTELMYLPPSTFMMSSLSKMEQLNFYFHRHEFQFVENCVFRPEELDLEEIFSLVEGLPSKVCKFF